MIRHGRVLDLDMGIRIRASDISGIAQPLIRHACEWVVSLIATAAALALPLVVLVAVAAVVAMVAVANQVAAARLPRCGCVLRQRWP